MVLSSIEIQNAIREKRLLIDPIPQPYFQEVGGPKCPYNTHSVDLTLGSEIVKPEKGTIVIDLVESGTLAKLISQQSQRTSITKERPLKLTPQTFILAQTREVIGLPIESALGARIEGKSSIARCGILVHFTAPTVHPGFHGPLTLEMINFGPCAFNLTPGMPIAQLIIEEVKGELLPNPSQFQNQKTPEGLQ